MRHFITATAAWDQLPHAPQLYGPFHLVCLLIAAPAAVFAAWRLQHCSARQGRCLLRAVWLFLVLGEVYKQLYLLAASGGQFSYWYLPFQLCSMPLYLCPAALQRRWPRLRQAACAFLCGYSALGGLLTLLFPEDLLRRSLTLTLHGFAWHLALLFLGCWLGFSGYGQSESLRKSCGGASALFLVCAGAALCLNLALWEPSGHTINLFYLGPMPNTQPVFSLLARAWGWLGCLPVYLLCVWGGGLLFLTLFVRLRKKTTFRPAAARTGS